MTADVGLKVAVTPYVNRITAAVRKQDSADPLFQILDDYASANVAHHTAAQAAEIEALRAEVKAIRTLMDIYTLGGWTDAVEPMKRALAAEARAERLAEALRDAKEKMLAQVKWVACDCGCERDKPADAVSVAWLRASDLLRDKEEGR